MTIDDSSVGGVDRIEVDDATGENVACPACGSRNFRLRAIDEHGSEQRSIYAFCDECGNATGKMWNRTVDNRLVEDDCSVSLGTEQ